MGEKANIQLQEQSNQLLEALNDKHFLSEQLEKANDQLREQSKQITVASDEKKTLVSLRDDSVTEPSKAKEEKEFQTLNQEPLVTLDANENVVDEYRKIIKDLSEKIMSF